MAKKFKMLAKEVAPGMVTNGGGSCGVGSCPAVLEHEDGRIVIIGKRLSRERQGELSNSGMVTVYEDEFAVEVDRDLLRKAFES